MCGILVYYGKEELTIDHPGLMSIAHRGPDGAGMQTFRVNDYFLSLGHRRLSIIDLSENAAQPMCYQDSRLWITYNGEIYNYLELRVELQQAGFKFSTDSDTEVLLASYHKWGEACLDKLNGMFAFAIWNDQSKTLFVVRDRYGVKPLYYWSTPHEFAIVSEIKQLPLLPGFKAAMNPEAAYQFLKYGDFCYDKSTLWKDVFELEPGMMFQINLNKWQPCNPITPQKWYDFTPHLNCIPVNESEAIEHFRFLLEDSIKLRLRSDVPVGFALSGGLDSSSITCLASKKFNQGSPLQTFSACYEEPNIDEMPFINAVLDDINVESHKVFVDPSCIIDNMDFVTTKHDLPTTRMTMFSHYHLCQTSHSIGTKVILEGQGPDEVLAGYISFFWAFLSELLFTFHGITAIREYMHFKRNNGSSLVVDAALLLRAMFPNLIKIYQNRNSHTPHNENYYDLDALEYSFVSRKPKIFRDHNSLFELHRTRMTLLRPILHNVDRSSMAHSVEIRSPFLDYRMMEFCLSLPASLKIRNSIQKFILREAMVDILPATVKERTDKVGFPCPEFNWAKGILKNYCRELLVEAKDIPFINSKAVQNKFDLFVKGLVPYDRIFWRLISFQRWLSIFNIST